MNKILSSFNIEIAAVIICADFLYLFIGGTKGIQAPLGHINYGRLLNIVYNNNAGKVVFDSPDLTDLFLNFFATPAVFSGTGVSFIIDAFISRSILPYLLASGADKYTAKYKSVMENT